MQDNLPQGEVKHKFTWASLGDIHKGRGSLGEGMPVLVYRLMQYTLREVLERDFGVLRTDHYFREAGWVAGRELANNVLDLSAPIGGFLADLQRVLRELQIGILRMEAYDPDTGEIVLTVSEDLDCSGLPITMETVCCYDEGFIAGILEAYTRKPYEVREIDCWATGDRVCRFRGVVRNPS